MPNARVRSYRERLAGAAEHAKKAGEHVERFGKVAAYAAKELWEKAQHGIQGRHAPERAFEELRRLEGLGFVTNQEREQMEQMLKQRGEDAAPAYIEEVQKFIEERYKVVQRTDKVRRGMFKDMLFLAEHGLFEEEEIKEIWRAMHDPRTSWQELQQISGIVNEKMQVARQYYGKSLQKVGFQK